jgi:hypothetical protein
LHADSRAIDAGQRLPGVNDRFTGVAPDLGAVELGCEEPHYGPRPAGEQDRVWPIDCTPAPAPTGVRGAAGNRQPATDSASLHANVPNPFNPRTRILFDLARSTPVLLTVHDVLGRSVQTLASGTHAAGTHQVDWDGRNAGGATVSSGVYFYQLVTSETARARRMLLLR